MKALIKEFKEFISRGNVMDMAVGVIIGGAFTAIVNSLVNDMLMPLLSLLTGGFDFSGCNKINHRALTGTISTKNSIYSRLKSIRDIFKCLNCSICFA